MLLFATREVGDTLGQLPVLQVEPLGRRDARSLLESVLPTPLDERVVERLILETRGNPLALIELPRGLTSTQLAGGFGLPVMVPLAESIEESFRRRLAGLPYDIAASYLLRRQNPSVIRHCCAAQLCCSESRKSASEAVESEELLAFVPQIAFRHPLFRSAVYGASGLKDRREIHHALAEATDPQVDPDRRGLAFFAGDRQAR